MTNPPDRTKGRRGSDEASRPTRILIADLASRLGWRLALLVLLLSLSSVTEGVGLTLLFPLLAQIGLGTAASQGAVGHGVGDALAFLGIGQTLVPILVLVGIAFVVQNVFFLAQSWLTAHEQNWYVANLRTELFEAIVGARWRFFVERRAGDLVAALVTEPQRLGTALHLLGLVAASGAFVAVYMLFALAVAWPIAAVVLVFAVVLSRSARPLMRLGRRAGTSLSEQAAAIQTLAGEFLSGAKVIKATASEARAAEAFATASQDAFSIGRVIAFYPNLIRAIYEVTAILLLLLCLWFGIEVIHVDSASIILEVYVFIRIFQRISVMQQNIQALQGYAPAILSIQRIADEARVEREARTESVSGEMPAPVEQRGAAIALRDVTVRYGDQTALASATVDIPAGSVFGLAGPSGAGKSTLVDCILGLVLPDEGRVEIDGHPLASLPLAAWRRTIGYVAQDAFFFNASIRDNIRWSHPDASEADLREAIRMAQADRFVASLPNGLDTFVGDRGVRFSGGERQRIALARALVGRVRLVVLDEATSALDMETERWVMDAIAGLRGSVTVIIIAHRLWTLRTADRFCFLEQGRIVEAGRWEEMMREGHRFHEFYGSQLETRG
ncbi:MAG TPA: ABC transporter ATP-binding protein [Stellaceae bacterium]|nr:ABC transporter ATP-binding protein [Stellaceae bacterium]